MRNDHAIHKLWDSLDRNFTKGHSVIDMAKLQDIRDSLFCPGPFHYYVVDFSLRECSYVHESVQEYFGVEPKDFSFEQIIQGIHPDDVQLAEACERTIHEFLYDFVDPSDALYYKRIYCIRIKNAQDEYKLISHQAITLSTDEEGKTAHVLNVHTEIDHLVTTNNRKISFIGMEGRPSYLGLDPFNPNFNQKGSRGAFSNREIEIMRLLADGYTNEEMGDLLHISPDTVRTHRKNILTKSDCRNTTQLIAKCIKEGLI